MTNKALFSSITAVRGMLLAVAVFVAAPQTPTADAQAPLLPSRSPKYPHKDPPLPPPCAPDGVCIPKRDTYGYYGTRWRRWSDDTDRRASDRAAEGDIPGPLPTIRPEDEDREAPPPSEEVLGPEEAFGPDDVPLPPLRPALEGPPQDPPEADEDGLPPLPPFPSRPPRPAGASIDQQRSRVANLPGHSTVKLRWERSQDTPPAMPVGLPGADGVLNKQSDDAPPTLPWLKAANGEAPPAADAGRLGASAGLRVDRSVRPVAARFPVLNPGGQVLYGSETPPSFLRRVLR